MNNEKNDKYYIEKILKDLKFISEHIEGVSEECLRSDEVLLDSMLFRLIQVYENSRKLTQNYKEEHSSVPWMDIAGFRNRIVHDYGNVDLSVVYQTVTQDVPWLIQEIEKG